MIGRQESWINKMRASVECDKQTNRKMLSKGIQDDIAWRLWCVVPWDEPRRNGAIMIFFLIVFFFSFNWIKREKKNKFSAHFKSDTKFIHLFNYCRFFRYIFFMCWNADRMKMKSRHLLAFFTNAGKMFPCQFCSAVSFAQSIFPISLDEHTAKRTSPFDECVT